MGCESAKALSWSAVFTSGVSITAERNQNNSHPGRRLINESINKKQQPVPKRFPTEYPTWNANKSSSSCLSMTLEKCAPPSDSTQSVNLITEDRAHEKDNKTCNGPLQSDMFGNSTSVLGTPIRNAQRQRIQLPRSKTPLQQQICIDQNRRMSKSLPIRYRQLHHLIAQTSIMQKNQKKHLWSG